MQLLRADVPCGVHVWRDSSNGPIVEAANVRTGGFDWRGREGRVPPSNMADLALRAGREVFPVRGDEYARWGNPPGTAFLEAIISAGLDEPGALIGVGFLNRPGYPGGS